MIESFLFFAQSKQPQGSMLIQFVPFILIFVLFWFLIIRPQRKREREHQSMLNSLQTGDRVVTSSGMFGDVAEVTPQTVVIEIAPKVKVTMQRQAISTIATRETRNSASSSSTTNSLPASEQEIAELDTRKRKRKK